VVVNFASGRGVRLAIVFAPAAKRPAFPPQRTPAVKASLPFSRKKHLFPNHPLQLVAFFTLIRRLGASLDRDFVQADILHGGPDDGEATGLRREHVDLIRALPHIAEQMVNWVKSARILR
jgi:hypothetical protein